MSGRCFSGRPPSVVCSIWVFLRWLWILYGRCFLSSSTPLSMSIVGSPRLGCTCRIKIHFMVEPTRASVNFINLIINKCQTHEVALKIIIRIQNLIIIFNTASVNMKIRVFIAFLLLITYVRPMNLIHSPLINRLQNSQMILHQIYFLTRQ